MKPGDRRITHGMTKTPEYWVWIGAKRRCSESGHKAFRSYGSRGIQMCDEWRNDFAAFYAHMGPRPSVRHSLDRIDNERGYEPGNCRWADMSTQARNTRRNHWIAIDGERRLLTDWAESSGVNHSTIIHRLKSGWNPKEAVFTKTRYSMEA